jgi:hypothetical protein
MHQHQMRWKLHWYNRIWMKVERKLSDENMKTEIEICETETETEFFWRKWKRKWNNIFRWNRCGNGSFRFRLIRNFCFRLIRNFCFMVVLHGQSGSPNI